jgi:Na+:H+ antiporter, NhaA family
MAAQTPQRKLLRRKVVDPVAEFLRDEAAGGIALLAGALVALLWVNLAGSAGYEELWSAELTLGVGDAVIAEDLRHWVNDGLMVLFFFLISLEIKRELVTGDLREPRAAALPVLAALGGVLVPAAIFLLVVGDSADSDGWAIPMATDAAFALGVLVILGDRVNVGVKLFLVTIAVVDDVIAIVVIAAAYTADLSIAWLGVVAAVVLAVVAFRKLGVASIAAYIPLGVVMWIAMHESGVHATLAGVILALLTPAHAVGGRNVLEELEDRVHNVSSYVVLPLFALANAGVELSGAASDSDARRVALAVALGLCAGKILGITAATWAAIRLRIGRLPPGVDRRGVIGAAALGGIGFTVSLFITPLAYPDESLAEGARLGILVGSIASAAIGVTILSGQHRRRGQSPSHC